MLQIIIIKWMRISGIDFAIQYLILVFNSGCQKYFVIQYFDISSIDIISFIYNVKIIWYYLYIQRYVESMKTKKGKLLCK